MNKIDAELIALLRRNGRESIANLSAAIGVSRTTIRHHLNKMESRGDIQGYTVRLREDASPRGIRALVMITIEGNKAEMITHQLYKIPAFQTIHATNGKWDLVGELQTGSIEEIDQALTTMRQIKGIAASETSILLATRPPSPLR